MTEKLALIEYSREVMPLVRTLDKKKQILKDFKETNTRVAELQQDVKQAQQKLADFLKNDDDYKQFTQEMKEVAGELKQALKAASKASGFKPKELKDYFSARNKEEGVKKAVVKGELFKTLDSQIDSNI